MRGGATYQLQLCARVRGSEGQRATQGRVALRELEVQGGRHVEVGEYEAGKVGGGVVLWGKLNGFGVLILKIRRFGGFWT